MPQTRIGPTTPQRDVKIGGVSYGSVFRSIRMRFQVPQLDSGAFSTEQLGPQFDAGITLVTLTCNGLMSQGATTSTPPVPPPQNVAVEVDYAGTVSSGVVTGTCKVVVTTMNTDEASLNIDYGADGETPLVMRSTSAYTVTWSTGA